jgi:hypothetical protein
MVPMLMLSPNHVAGERVSGHCISYGSIWNTFAQSKMEIASKLKYKVTRVHKAKTRTTECSGYDQFNLSPLKRHFSYLIDVEFTLDTAALTELGGC